MSSILRYFSYSCTFCWLFWIFSSNHKIRLIFFTHLEKASKTLVGFFLNWEMKKSDSTGLFRHFYFCNILLSQFCVVCSHCLLLRLVEVHNLMNLLQKLFWIFLKFVWPKYFRLLYSQDQFRLANYWCKKNFGKGFATKSNWFVQGFDRKIDFDSKTFQYWLSIFFKLIMINFYHFGIRSIRKGSASYEILAWIQ